MLPCANPKRETCIPDVRGMRQLSVPPAPITVGAEAVVAGMEPGLLPAPL